MRLLVSADWQADLKNLDRCELAVDQIIRRLAEKHGTDFLHLGDAKDKHNPVDQRVTNFLISAFTRIKKVARKMLYVRGNHDQIHVQDGSASCVPVFEAVGFDAIADATWEEVVLGSGVNLWMVPYFRDADAQEACFHGALAARLCRPKCEKNILAFHNTLSGCDLNANRVGTGLSVDDVGADKYDLCVGGHVHMPQFLAPNVHYCGSPFPVDWNEVNQQKRFLEIET